MSLPAPEGGRTRVWAPELTRRVGSVLASLPAETKQSGGPALRLNMPDICTPHWLFLPIWLNEAWQEGRSGRLPAGDLADLLWGQYALFLYIRIQDDLLDRQRDDLRLLFVADRFLLESLESFQRFSALDRAFWAFYRGCVRETVDAILEVWRLEQKPGQFASQHLGLHARVSGIFKLGAAAICRLHSRTEEMSWVSNLLDGLAVFSQICDDLQDLAADLEVGRFTWVANTLLAAKAGEAIAPDERARRLGDGLMQPDRAARVLGELRCVARAAADAVPKSAPPLVHDLGLGLNARPDELEQSLHEARVRWLFGEALAGDDSTARVKLRGRRQTRSQPFQQSSPPARPRTSR